MITNSMFLDDIKEFQMLVKIKEISKRRKSKLKNLRLIMVDNKPCIQLVSPRKGNIKEIDMSKIAGVFLCQNSKRNCFKLIFPDKTMIFFQSDISSHYEIFQKNLNEIINQNYNSGAFPNMRTRRSQPIISNKELVSKFAKLSRSTSVILNKEIEAHLQRLSRSPSVELNEEMEAKLTKLLNELSLLEETSKDDELFHRCYPIPEINLQVDPLNGDDKFPDCSLKFPYSYISKLRKEIVHLGGIKIDFTDKYFDKYILTTMNNELWVSDIIKPDDTKKELHFGDRIVAVNGKNINDIFGFQETTKHKSNFTLTIQRLPKAKVFLMDGNMKIKPSKKGFKIEEIDKSWQITELNEEYLLNSVENKSKQIKNIIQSDEIRGVVLHEKTFINTLREQIKNVKYSIKI